MSDNLPPLPETGYVLGIVGDGYSADRCTSLPAWDDDAVRAYAASAVAAAVAQERERQCGKIETLLHGIGDARRLMEPIWRKRMGAESVREYVQRGLRCLDSAIRDCDFTGHVASQIRATHTEPKP